jgi:hypothetical protein
MFWRTIITTLENRWAAAAVFLAVREFVSCIVGTQRAAGPQCRACAPLHIAAPACTAVVVGQRRVSAATTRVVMEVRANSSATRR